jgi:hypothetical protein
MFVFCESKIFYRTLGDDRDYFPTARHFDNDLVVSAEMGNSAAIPTSVLAGGFRGGDAGFDRASDALKDGFLGIFYVEVFFGGERDVL